MLSFPNIKINLGLNVIQKRADGYHELESVFYPMGWTDALEIIKADKFQFTSTGIAVPGDTDQNLVVKAFRKIQAIYNIEKEVAIHLHKVIPTGAGLGGGSADAVFAIKLVSELFNLQIPLERQLSIAAELGSDCPFFVHNTPCIVTGRGDILKPISLDLSHWHFVVVHPGIHVATADAFAGIRPSRHAASVNEIVLKPVTSWKDTLVNDFEKTVFAKFPEIQKLKESMYRQGAVYTSMSGSGSAVFGMFAEPVELDLPAQYKVWQS